MSLRVKTVDLAAEASTIVAPHVPQGFAKHQFAFTGSTGTVLIEGDLGAGYQTLLTLDLTKADNRPYVIEAEILAFRITPSVVTTMAYCAQELA